MGGRVRGLTSRERHAEFVKGAKACPDCAAAINLYSTRCRSCAQRHRNKGERAHVLAAGWPRSILTPEIRAELHRKALTREARKRGGRDRDTLAAEAQRLYAKGLSQEAIAGRLGCGRALVAELLPEKRTRSKAVALQHRTRAGGLEAWEERAALAAAAILEGVPVSRVARQFGMGYHTARAIKEQMEA